MFFSKFAKLCNHHYNPILPHFQSPQKIPTPTCSQPLFRTPRPQRTTNLFPTSLYLLCLDILCKWNHIIIVICVQFLSLHLVFLRFLHVVAGCWILFCCIVMPHCVYLFASWWTFLPVAARIQWDVVCRKHRELWNTGQVEGNVIEVVFPECTQVN